jgi:hypothetical protein
MRTWPRHFDRRKPNRELPQVSLGMSETIRSVAALGTSQMLSSALRQNPGDPTLSLNCRSMRVAPSVHGVAPVVRGRAARMLESTTHRARERDCHAAITGPVICRRVIGQPPHQRARRPYTNDDACHYKRGAAFARRERIPRWRLACVDRRRLLRSANSIRPQYMHLPPAASSSLGVGHSGRS